MGRRKRRQYPKIEKLEIEKMAAEGKALARVDNKAVFVPFAVPGDVVDVQVTRSKSSFMEAKVLTYHSLSPLRTEARCEHFGVCGGCKWQMLPYEEQLKAKQQQVYDQLSRLGDFYFPPLKDIIPSPQIYFYRNKLEYTFSNKKWLTTYSKDIDFDDRNMNGLGFHMPGMFDRILDIENCYLQAEPSNDIRLAIRAYAHEKKLSFYDAKQHVGFLRNLIIRTASTGDIMLILIVGEDKPQDIKALLSFVAERFPQLSSIMYVINQKRNDTINDLEVHLFKGLPYIMEKMGKTQFRVGPVSFYQTNSQQAHTMYKKARKWAKLTGEELVYDLYTGTGTIANFVAHKAAKVIGIEYVPEAIEDAKRNSALNDIGNTAFFAGDMAKILTAEFIAEHGRPDVVITDPPRAGMHEKVVKQLLAAAPKRIVYISCNPATQARDISWLKEAYRVVKVQPIDMFPHTHHMENIVLLKRKKTNTHSDE